MPDFDEHNGQSAKRRASETKRKRNERESAELPQPVRTVSASRADKKRTREEEEKNSSSLRSEEKPQRSRAAPPPSKPDDVTDQTWADWLQLRSKKRAPVTETVLTQARTEAIKAGMSLQRFLEIWCMRGSQGLQADWLRAEERRGNTQRQAAAAGVFGPSHPRGGLVNA